MFRRLIRVTRMSETIREIGKNHESENKAFGHLECQSASSIKCDKYRLLQHTVNNRCIVIWVKEDLNT